MTRKKVGLVLGSGGVRGLAHIGVIKTLLKHHIPIDYLAGASVGSWISAHYALFQDIEKTAELTIGKKKEKIISFLEPTISGGLIKGEKLENLLNSWLDNADFKDLKIPLSVAATNLKNGDKVTFNHGKLSTAVRASMSVPGFFKPASINNQLLIDGGLSNPVPCDLVKELGADIIIAVNLDFCRKLEDSKQISNLPNITSRSIEIMRHHLAQYSSASADFIIQPYLRNYSSWREYFTKNQEAKIVNLGALATEKIIDQLIIKINQ